MARQPTNTQSKLRKKSSIRRGIAGAIFGHIPGVPIGTVFENRKALNASSVHPPLVAGIYGRKETGARSVVLGGHYEDEDYGDHFTYIGSGGRAPGVRFGPQTEDQTFDNNLNAALLMSAKLKRPVRVIRGAGLKSKYAPNTGFRYDGLYTVSKPRIEVAQNGLKVCKFNFERCLGQPPVPTTANPDFYRSDIEIRREQYREMRATKAREDGVESGAASRETSAGAEEEEDEEEDQEDIFGDIDDVEAEMRDVAGYLDELKNDATSHGRRRRLLVTVGAHVEAVLSRKAAQGHDEGGRDLGWWYDALWSYVGCAMPTSKVVEPQTVEGWYRKYAAQLARRDAERARG